ncbi:MAG: hypothetical protein ACYC1T_02650 [Sulfuricaulis sp.]
MTTKNAKIILFIATALSFTGCDAVVDPLLFERQTIETGSFRGIQIGSSKMDVLRQVKTLGAYAVKPIPRTYFEITAGSIKEIDKLRQAEGIRITDHRGLAIDLKFDSGSVKLIRRSVPAKDNSWFFENQIIDDVITEIRKRFNEHPSLVVFPIVFYEGDGWVNVTGSLDEPIKTLRPYDAWTFGIASDKPGGSHFDLYFDGDRLTKINYRRERIRLD